MAQNFQGNFNPIFRPSVLQMGQQQHQQVTAMPQPSSTPWTIENMPWAQQRVPMAHSQLMQFEARTNIDKRGLLHAKRKSDITPTAAAPPTKQFISEEKISAHFNGLHISNNFSQQNTNSLSMEDALMASTSTASDEYRVTAKELEEKLKNANRITVWEDVLKMHQEQKKMSILPEALINHIEKPCTALVLWQPPPILKLLHRKNEEELKKAKADCSNFNKQKTSPGNLIDDIEFADAEEIDDFIDNNNTCNVDYNEMARMDEDL